MNPSSISFLQQVYSQIDVVTVIKRMHDKGNYTLFERYSLNPTRCCHHFPHSNTRSSYTLTLDVVP
jgi:hypothetical protein